MAYVWNLMLPSSAHINLSRYVKAVIVIMYDTMCDTRI